MLKTVSSMMSAPHTKDSFVSTGRGGAGNLGPSSPQMRPTMASLSTPTIKKDTYTTGRGGAGNMSRNLPEVPEMARAAQDVEHSRPTKHRDSMHSGRGGAGNFRKSPKVRPALTSNGSSSATNRDADSSSVHSGASSVLILDDDVEPMEKKKGRAGSKGSQLSEAAGAVLNKFRRQPSTSSAA